MAELTAVVCAAHTDLGKHVTRQLLQSTHVSHIFALTEIDLLPTLTRYFSLPSIRLKLTQLINPLDYVERTIAFCRTFPSSIDLSFYCVYSPKYVLPSLGTYLYNKLNYDIPLRFIHEMAVSKHARSVCFVSHPSASPALPSEYLRIKGELRDRAVALQASLFPAHVVRLSLMLVPVLFSSSKRPYINLVNDHIYNGIRPTPLSTLDSIKQKTILKHDPDTYKPLLAKDVASAMVADSVHAALAAMAAHHPTDLLVYHDPPDILDLAKTARALRKHTPTTTIQPHTSTRRRSRQFKTGHRQQPQQQQQRLFTSSIHSNSNSSSPPYTTTSPSFFQHPPPPPYVYQQESTGHHETTSARHRRRKSGSISQPTCIRRHAPAAVVVRSEPLNTARKLGDKLARPIITTHNNPNASSLHAHAHAHSNGAEIVRSRSHHMGIELTAETTAAAMQLANNGTPMQQQRRRSVSIGRASEHRKRLTKTRSFHSGDARNKYHQEEESEVEEWSSDEEDAKYTTDMMDIPRSRRISERFIGRKSTATSSIGVLANIADRMRWARNNRNRRATRQQEQDAIRSSHGDDVRRLSHTSASSGYTQQQRQAPPSSSSCQPKPKPKQKQSTVRDSNSKSNSRSVWQTFM